MYFNFFEHVENKLFLLYVGLLPVEDDLHLVTTVFHSFQMPDLRHFLHF